MLTCLMRLALHPATLAPVPLSCLLPLRSPLPSSGRCTSAHVFRSVLCFHTLTKAFSRSSFLLTFLQNPRGCHPSMRYPINPQSANSSPVNDSSRCAHRFPNGMRRLSALKMSARQYYPTASWQYNRATTMALSSGTRLGTFAVEARCGRDAGVVAQPLMAVRRM